MSDKNKPEKGSAGTDSSRSDGYTGALWYADIIEKTHASRFSFFLAKLFGIKRVANDIDRHTGANMQVTMYYFRSKYYVTECRFV